MSASSIATRVPVGQATKEAFHARSQELLAQRAGLRRSRVAERRAEFAERGIGGAERLGELAGRCDAVAGLVPERELSQVREAIERGSGEKTAARIEQLEERAERNGEERLRREVLLEEVVAANGGEVLGEVEWRADGSSSAIVGFPDEVRIRVTMTADPAAADGATETIAWHTADSNIASQAAAEGAKAGCAAELSYVEGIVASYPEMSFDERSRAEAEAIAAEEAEEEEEGWEEMEA
ncbi:MAG TPA: hypothetical protein VLI94_07445 [Solirubrobacterales bacterium]|nr:hypothetical protein [Solirubrobacterales bacterium]